MLKKQELMNPASCLNKAGPNERVFVLRENDPLFAQTVRHWATMAENLHEDAKVKEARLLADAAEKDRRERELPCAEPAPDRVRCAISGCENPAAKGSNFCLAHSIPNPAHGAPQPPGHRPRG